MLSKNTEVEVGIIFGFSLYTAPLQVTLAIYFRRALIKTRRIKPFKGSKVYHYQHQKIVLVLVNFQNKAITV